MMLKILIARKLKKKVTSYTETDMKQRPKRERGKIDGVDGNPLKCLWFILPCNSALHVDTTLKQQ